MLLKKYERGKKSQSLILLLLLSILSTCQMFVWIVSFEKKIVCCVCVCVVVVVTVIQSFALNNTKRRLSRQEFLQEGATSPSRFRCCHSSTGQCH